jgi:hypothetical protein
MDNKDCLIQLGTLAAGRNHVTGHYLKAKGIRGSQSTLGNNNIDRSLLWVAAVPFVPPANTGR